MPLEADLADRLDWRLIWLPLSCHSATVPSVLLRHRMSLLPSPLKSPVGGNVPVKADLAERGVRLDLRAVELPLRHRAVVDVAPEDVALAVAVEIGEPH